MTSALKNQFDPANGDWSQHPYRFVFLNCCETADNVGWAHAFGISRRISEEALAAGTEPQAFVGWNGSPRAAISDDDWNNEAKTYAVFFNAWMSGLPLEDCINAASDQNTLLFPLGLPFPWYEYALPSIYHVQPYRIKIFGYAGLTRSGFVDGYDNSKYYH